MSPILAILLLTATNGYGPIDWKVGDHMEYEIDMVAIGKVGTMVNDVTADTGDAVWLRQQTIITGSPDEQEMLVQKSDGAILDYKKNGQEATYTDNVQSIVSTNQATVSVAAGKFTTTHTVVQTTDSGKVEIWTNADATPIDGMIKTLIGTGIGSTIQLTRFVRGH